MTPLRLPVRLSASTLDGAGGNPAVVTRAAAYAPEEMRAQAERFGTEMNFLLPAEGSGQARVAFFVPGGELAMCGHGLIAAAWSLWRLGRWPGSGRGVMETVSGPIDCRVSAGEGPVVEIVSQRNGVRPVEDPSGALLAAAADALGLSPAGLAIVNAGAARPKTILHLPDPGLLDRIEADAGRVAEACDRLGSTGLYPVALRRDRAGLYEARQFPCRAGFLEDAATGVAAAGLAAVLAERGDLPPGSGFAVLQGRAMGRPSRIEVRQPRDAAPGTFLIGGRVAEKTPTQRLKPTFF
jgi:PhzF family phenazine biosynthesis protein